MPKYIDTHCHVNFSAIEKEREEVIKRALDEDTWIINAGTQIDTSKKAIEIANEYKEGVYAAIALHPIHTDKSFHDEDELGAGNKEFTSRGEMFDKEAYKKMAENEKVVAIGECGLDYFRTDPSSIQKQKDVFIEQIKLANEVGKPLMLHIRDAYEDTLSLLKEHLDLEKFPKDRRGMVHFFAGNKEQAKSYLDFGFILSFTGVITFTHDYDEVVKNTPLDMILTDTDSPYVAPVPHRGKRNEPVYVKEIVKRIAEIKELPEDEVAEAIIKNARRLFGI